MAKAKRPPQTTKKLGGPRVSPEGPRRAKVDAVEDFKSRVDGSAAVILTEYRGMTVGELAELRAGLREAGADYKVFKNTLATIAVRDLGFTELEAFLGGPTGIAFANEDVVNAAKRLAEFAKRVPTLVLKGGLLDGRVLSEADVKALAALDSREVMLAKIAGLFASPLQKVAYLFAAPLQQVGALFAQLKDKLPAEPAAASSATDPMAEPQPGPQPADAVSQPPADTAGEVALEPASQPAAPEPDEAPEASSGPAAEPAGDGAEEPGTPGRAEEAEAGPNDTQTQP